MPKPMRTVALLFAGAAALAACSGGTPSTTPASATSSPTNPVTEATAEATSATVEATASTAATTGAVSANTATTEELIAALEAAGVPNADRWAGEIEEYRPYDVADPTLGRLQDNLAKYDPDPATLAAILSALQP